MVYSCLSLGFSEIDVALDLSWIADLGQGNFTQAQAAVDYFLQTNKHNAQLYFAQAILHQLRGKYNLALALLEQALSLEKNLDKKYLIIAYANQLIKQLKLFSQTDLSKSSRNFWREKLEQIPRKKINSNYQLMVQIIETISLKIPSYKAKLAALIKTEQSVSNYLDEIQALLVEQIQSAQNTKQQFLAQILYLNLAELLFISKEKQSAIYIIDKLTQAQKIANNSLELANCLLKKADLLLSQANFGELNTLGYSPELIQTIFAKNFTVVREITRLNIGQITQLYLDARDYFTQAQARRGEAFVVTRLAYLNAISGKWFLAALGYEEAKKMFGQVGDYLQVISAEIGEIWANLRCSEEEKTTKKLIERVITLTESLIKNGNILTAHTWLIIFLGAAAESLINIEDEYDLTIAQRYINLCFNLSKIIYLNLDTEVKKKLEIYATLSKISHKFYQELTLQAYYTQALIVADLNKQIQYYCHNQQLNNLVKNEFLSIVNLNKITAKISAKTLIVNYGLLDNNLVGWAINKQGLVNYFCQESTAQFLANNISFTDFLEEWQTEIIAGKVKPTIVEFFSTYLIEPFQKEIKAAEIIIVIPPTKVNDFPLHTLPWTTEIGSSYLGLSKFIIYTTSLAAINSYFWQQVNPSLSKLNLQVVKSYQKLEIFSSLAQLTYLAFSQSLINLIGYQKPADLKQKKAPDSLVSYLLPINAQVTYLLTHQNIYIEVLKQLQSTNRCVGENNILILQIWFNNNQPLSAESLEEIRLLTRAANFTILVVNSWSVNNLSTLLLYYLLIRNLKASESSLDLAWQKAQKQLKEITNQQAINFCQFLQKIIPVEGQINLAKRAILTKHIGDLMAQKGNYQQAVEAYSVAGNILSKTLSDSQLEKLKQQSNQYQILAKNTQYNEPAQLLFNSIEYWSNVAVFS